MNDSFELPPPSRPPVVDERILAELAEAVEDPTFVPRILDRYLAQARSELDELEGAIAHDESPRSAKIAHKLKSASATVGALRLSRLLAEIEATSKRGGEGARALLGALRVVRDETWRALAPHAMEAAP